MEESSPTREEEPTFPEQPKAQRLHSRLQREEARPRREEQFKDPGQEENDESAGTAIVPEGRGDERQANVDREGGEAAESDDDESEAEVPRNEAEIPSLGRTGIFNNIRPHGRRGRPA